MLAKLTRPKVHRALPRERLFKRMDDSLEKPLLWIVAPGGSGKTTLVASYLDARKLQSVWYQLDPGDGDVATFFYYLAQSIPPSRNKRAQQPLPLLTPEHQADLPGFYRHFFRAFFARLTAPAVLALDNYHEVPQGSSLHGVLEHAVQEAPEGINVVVMSRSQPPRTLIRLKSAERLDTLDWPQLRMTLEETREIATARIGADEKAARRIFRMSDGWAAGIALTIQRGPVSDWSEEDHEAKAELFDYFAAQALSTTPAETQQFLKRTALLPDMTAETAATISGCTECETLLEELYRLGMFIDRRNTRPPTYHYHDLFREFLLTQLEVSKEELHRLQGVAAALLESTGRPDEAIRLYLTAGDWQAAKRLIITVARAMVAQGRGSSLRDWIGALPVHMSAEDPWLGYWFAATLSRVKPVEARPHFERALEEFSRRGDIQAQRLLCSEVILTYMHEFASMTPLDPWLDRLFQLLAAPVPFPSAAMELQARIACLFALDFRRPDPVQLAACVARVEELLEAEIPPDLAGLAVGIMVMHLYCMADMSTCSRVVARARKMLEATSGLSPVGRALTWMQLGHATLRGGDAEEAQRCLNRALEIGAENAIALPTLYVFSHFGLAFCALERGDLAVCQQHRRKFEEYWIPTRKIDGTAALRVQLWTECRRGHWEAALGLARRHREAAHDCGMFMLSFEADVLLAIVCAQNGRAAECREALQPVPAKLAGTAYAHFAYEVDLVEAYLALLSDDRNSCHARLRTGLSQCQRDQGMFLMRMQPEILPRLAAEALSAGIEPDFVREMIRRYALYAPPGADERWPWPLRIITLGRFEVLRDGQPLEFSRKAPKKTLALLKALIAFGGRNVREQLLLDTFWSDEEGDVANRSLTAALHRLRGLVGDDVVVQQGGKLSLDSRRVWVDVWSFEELAGGPRGSATIDTLLGLYRGAFLADDEGEPWSVTLRERLRGKFIHLVSDLAGTLESAGNFEPAIECYLRGLDADPAIEQFYQGLMRCYARLDRKSEAIAAYQRLKRMLSVLLAIKPSATTERLYQSLR
jgi:LuxR family transcriptional regulator, maltose regulon positive regulatory protein